MQQITRLKLEAHALQHMTVAAPNVHLIDTKTTHCGIHSGASLAKSKG
jgi:hypothetical protein